MAVSMASNRAVKCHDLFIPGIQCWVVVINMSSIDVTVQAPDQCQTADRKASLAM